MRKPLLVFVIVALGGLVGACQRDAPPRPGVHLRSGVTHSQTWARALTATTLPRLVALGRAMERCPDGVRFDADAIDVDQLPQFIRCTDDKGALQGTWSDGHVALVFAADDKSLRISRSDGAPVFPRGAGFGLIDPAAIVSGRVALDPSFLTSSFEGDVTARLIAAALTGDVGFAVYPTLPKATPRVAALVGVRGVATSGLDRVISQVGERLGTVPVRSEEPGGMRWCLPKLAVVEGFQPCAQYLELQGVVLIGYDVDTLNRALQHVDAAPGPTLVRLNLEHLNASDVALGHRPAVWPASPAIVEVTASEHDATMRWAP